MKKLIKLGFLIMFFSVCTLMYGATALKAQDSGIQISPIDYQFEIKPGESQTGKMTVTNKDKTALDYTVEMELFSKVDEEGAPSFAGTQKTEGVTSLVDWIAIADADKSGQIEASSKKQFEFTINVPLGAEPGGHYAAIFIKQIKKDEQGKTQLGVSSRVGLLLLVSVPGNVKKVAKIESFTYPKFIWQGISNTKTREFEMRVSNEGSVHFDSTSKVELKPILGKIQTVELGTHTILPDNTRVFKSAWLNKYPFGYYRITATATDGNGKTMATEGGVWAIPLIIVVPLLVGILLLWWLLHYIKSNFQFVKKDK